MLWPHFASLLGYNMLYHIPVTIPKYNFCNILPEYIFPSVSIIGKKVLTVYTSDLFSSSLNDIVAIGLNDIAAIEDQESRKKELLDYFEKSKILNKHCCSENDIDDECWSMSVLTTTLDYAKLEDEIKHVPEDHPGRIKCKNMKSNTFTTYFLSSSEANCTSSDMEELIWNATKFSADSIKKFAVVYQETKDCVHIYLY